MQPSQHFAHFHDKDTNNLFYLLWKPLELSDGSKQWWIGILIIGNLEKLTSMPGDAVISHGSQAIDTELVNIN